MKVYNRDFNYLTEEEQKAWELIKEQEKVIRGNFRVTRNKFHEYPKAVRYYKSLFPNNYLDIMDLKEIEKLNTQLDQFIELVRDSNSNERTLLNYINQNQAYPIIASLFKSYQFGHHAAFIFPEFQLGNTYQVDYLLVGKSSGGYEFIFVELEHPRNKIFLQDGTHGEAFRKGLKQVKDWKRWLEVYFSSLNETFKKYVSPRQSLPEEFLVPDRTRYHYVVVAGQRTDFEKNKDLTYRTRREEAENKILLLHYDNLYDMAKRIIGENNY
ncbi:Shedu anti-phage system protein SduA domain-containing protein [Mesobacillus foraminis]|uniref:Shedu anti-phage system protein SduA domain-containing protein n=1 Tax=Mesobacillus foraminis TaxID=279826 RepID=UPI0039A0AFC0